MRTQYRNSLWVIIFFGIIALCVCLSSCRKQEDNYHRNDRDVYFFNQRTDSIMIDISGNALIMAAGDTSYYKAGSTHFAWFLSPYTVRIIKNNQVGEVIIRDIAQDINIIK